MLKYSKNQSKKRDYYLLGQLIIEKDEMTVNQEEREGLHDRYNAASACK